MPPLAGARTPSGLAPGGVPSGQEPTAQGSWVDRDGDESPLSLRAGAWRTRSRRLDQGAKTKSINQGGTHSGFLVFEVRSRISAHFLQGPDLGVA